MNQVEEKCHIGWQKHIYKLSSHLNNTIHDKANSAMDVAKQILHDVPDPFGTDCRAQRLAICVDFNITTYSLKTTVDSYKGFVRK